MQLHKLKGVEMTWRVDLEIVLTCKKAGRTGLCRTGSWCHGVIVSMGEDMTPLGGEEDR